MAGSFPALPAAITIYTKAGRMERLVIPIHGDHSLKIGLRSNLMKLIPVRENEL